MLCLALAHRWAQPSSDMKIDLSGFKRPALQFSGGKDSLALVYLLKDQLESITLYWMNAGDACPETMDVIRLVREMVPNFIEVQSDVAAWRKQHGNPTDLLPSNAHFLGVSYGLSKFSLTGRFDCCYYNLMRPLHDRMLADGVDLVIRGTKLMDTGAVPHEGPAGAYEVLLPIKDWSHEDVFAYLRNVGAPTNTIYDYFSGGSAPECLGCTAWWDDGKGAYLKNRHPEKYREYRITLESIRRTLVSHMNDLDSELS